MLALGVQCIGGHVDDRTSRMTAAAAAAMINELDPDAAPADVTYIIAFLRAGLAVLSPSGT